MTALVECRGVWKRYRRPALGIKSLLVGRSTPVKSRYARDWALQNVSFEVMRGASFGVVGHNGTGKSTLLSLLLGTIAPDRGDIRVHGRVASLLELGAGFHPELTGRENIFLYGSILGMTLGEIRRVYESIVDFSELGGAIENPIRTYSNGMIARLGFSTIIHTPADIILIDEVLAVGDSRFKQKCTQHLRDFKARNGTLIIVSHEMETLADMCEVGMCLELGQVVEIGEMDRIIARHEAFMQQGRDDPAGKS